MIRRTLFATGALATAITVFGASGANAQVTNGGFESGNTGWTLGAGGCTGTLGNSDIPPAYTGAITGGVSSPHSGRRDAWFGAVPNADGSPCVPSLSQTLTTVVGQSYDLSFWLQVTWAYLNIPNEFRVTLNGNPVFDGQVTNFPWQEMTYGFTGTGSDVVEFAGYNPNGGTELDDVGISAVPEPTSMTLLATGLLGMAGAAVRRRKRSTKE